MRRCHRITCCHAIGLLHIGIDRFHISNRRFSSSFPIESGGALVLCGDGNSLNEARAYHQRSTSRQQTLSAPHWLGHL